jgi:hypothetical protein
LNYELWIFHEYSTCAWGVSPQFNNQYPNLISSMYHLVVSIIIYAG